MRFWLIILFLFFSLTLTLTLTFSCGKYDENLNYSIASDSNSSSNSSSRFDYFTAAKAAGPVISPALISTDMFVKDIFNNDIVTKATWSSGGILYEIYQLIRDYQYPRDEGVIDGSNMYKAMHTVNSTYSSSSQCTTIADQSVSPPFNFGSDQIDQTYNCSYSDTSVSTPTSGGSNTYYTSLVRKEVGNESFVNVGWSYVGSNTTQNAMQGQFNTTTKQVKINLTYLVTYSSTNKYSVRIHVSGNTDTGLFTLRLSKCSISSGTTTCNSIAGYGYSKGSNYYLFKVLQGSSDPKYFCFASDTTETVMKSMSDSGSSTVPSNCTNYAANLPANYSTSGSDNPSSTNSFTGTGDYKTTLTWQ
ncbi:MAG: hypothetical protein HQK49_21665 [Oligoflexia bacterium]|nr:hypothetical protein [Oligoflexia bacterium]